MSTVHIFWIEDNTLQEDTTMREGLEFPSLGGAEDGGLFSFKIFQHPVEVHEYLSLVEELKARKPGEALGDSDALPDIVVFDYKLADNFTTTGDGALSYRKEPQYEFLRSHSASVALRDRFKEVFGDRVLFCERSDVRGGTYRSDEFRKALCVPEVIGINDEFGLFAGLAVVREFKEYVTIGVPATVSKPDPSSMTDNALFYEWLNSYDLKDAINRPKKGEKNWGEILKFALPLLRKRIAAQVRAGKVTPDYQQLVRLSKPNSKEKIFSFTSAYGERRLPLDGLFLDKTQTVQNWAGELMKSLPNSDKVVARAIKVSDRLWDKYRKKFVDRIDLSDYKFRETRGGLNAEEKRKFARLKRTYCTGDKFKGEVSIQHSFEKPSEERAAVRLAVLHLAARAEIEMSKCAEESPNSAFYAELSKYEKFNVLFPFYNLMGRTGSLLLPMHATSDWDELSNRGRKWLADNLKLGKDAAKVTPANCLYFEKWITEGEKTLLKAVFYEDKEFYPRWLR
jgi:hypothetical protein